MDTNEFLPIIGYKLTGFEQVHDYWQLKFENGILSIFTKFNFDGFSNSTSATEILKALSELTVVDAYYDDIALSIDFGGLYILASLKQEDYTGPEAICWYGPENEIMVFN